MNKTVVTGVFFVIRGESGAFNQTFIRKLNPIGNSLQTTRFSDSRLGLFAKYWQAGKVKTRLARRIGHRSACEIYRVFLSHLLENLDGLFAAQTVVFSPPDRKHEFAAIAPHWQIEPQSGGDLGQRMYGFFESAFSDIDQPGIKKVVVIGADSPHLPLDILQQACAGLDDHDVTIGPCSDGGYYLIGIRHRPLNVFEDIDWSTDRVLKQTMQRIREQDLTVCLLPELCDVDEPDDLDLLLEFLKNESTEIGRYRNLLYQIQSVLDVSSPGAV